MIAEWNKVGAFSSDTESAFNLPHIFIQFIKEWHA